MSALTLVTSVLQQTPCIAAARSAVRCIPSFGGNVTQGHAKVKPDYAV